MLISKRQSIQGVEIVNSSNAIVGYFYQKQNNIIHYFQLKRINDSLLRENSILRNSIAAQSNIDTFFDLQVSIADRDTTNFRKTIEVDSFGKPIGSPRIVKYQDYHYIPARVINNSISQDKMNFITLNRGSKDGVERNMSVVGKNGIVGRVAHVSDHYASVVSVLTEGRNYSACLQDGTESYVTWTHGSPDFVHMDKIPLYTDVRLGDTVFTTGNSYFPDNIMIGRIAQVDTIEANNSKSLKVRLSTNFRNLHYVYIVGNKNADERLKLEAKSEAEKGK